MRLLRRSNRIVALYLADLHCGHKLGLMSPDTVLWDENEYSYRPAMTRVQEYLWRCFIEDLGGVREFAGGSPVVVVVVGDVTQGSKYPSQLVSTRPSDQIIIAVDCLNRVLAEIPKVVAVRLIIGTLAHTLGEETSPLLVSKGIGHENVSVVQHGLFNIGEVKQDVAHHGPGLGIRNWLHGNILQFYVLSLMQDSLDMGMELPRVVVRAHRHGYAHRVITKVTVKEEYVCDAFAIPSYCGLSGYARQTGQSPSLLTNGMLALACRGGQLESKVFRHSVDVRTEETFNA